MDTKLEVKSILVEFKNYTNDYFKAATLEFVEAYFKEIINFAEFKSYINALGDHRIAVTSVINSITNLLKGVDTLTQAIDNNKNTKI